MKRTVDTTKKSNIKCEHCECWQNDICVITGERKSYWHRCKKFKWAERYKNGL